MKLIEQNNRIQLYGPQGGKCNHLQVYNNNKLFLKNTVHI